MKIKFFNISSSSKLLKYNCLPLVYEGKYLTHYIIRHLKNFTFKNVKYRWNSTKLNLLSYISMLDLYRYYLILRKNPNEMFL